MQAHLINLFMTGFLLGIAFAIDTYGVIYFLLAMLNFGVYCKYENNQELHSIKINNLVLFWR